VLAARIDRLPAAQKALLQTAAVIGRTFTDAILAKATGQSGEELETALQGLRAAEFVQEVHLHPVAEYRFWHPLTQEVAYATLLAGRRVRIHAAVAEALAYREAGRLDELSAVLAWHWERAERPLEAARWSLRAAGFAQRSDLNDALRRWGGVVDLLERVEDSPAKALLGVRARVRLLQYGADLGVAPEEVERLHAEGRAEAQRVGDTTLLGLVEAGAGTPKLYRGDIQGALKHYLEAARLADETEDRELQAALLWRPAFVLIWAGPLAEGLAWVDRAIEAAAGQAGRGATFLGFSPLAVAQFARSVLHARMGRLAEAREEVERALALARDRAENEVLPWILADLSHVIWLTGEGEMLGPAQEAVRLAEDTGYVSMLTRSLEALAVAELAAGRPARAVATCERALAGTRERGHDLFVTTVLVHLARARLASGDPVGAVAAADEAVALAHRQGARVVECLALLIRAQVARVMAGPGACPDAAHADLQAALRLVTETGAKAYEPFIHEEVGRLENDRDELNEALRLFSDIGATGHVRRLEEELAGPGPLSGHRG
jgi:adenylate cyclase